jgi:phage tail sheath protein FI
MATTNLAGGADDNLATLGLNEYQAGLTALETISDVNIVCAPGRTDVGVQQALVAHCENLKDRFAILDSVPGTPPYGNPSSLTQIANVTSARGYAALYYPWIVINDPTSLTGNDTVLVPPSGAIGGIYARVDTQRGVHKAPANEYITGAVDLERNLSDGDQGQINIEGVDALRVFPGQRPIVWGARTTAPPDQIPWRYVNVRRLFIFVEQSIKQGILWAVFEPNDQTLWKKLNRTISEFLTRVWRSGALFGSTAAQAFYVKIDDENNPPSLQELGQLVLEIGMAPVRPAEFVIVRIAMWDGGSQTTE